MEIDREKLEGLLELYETQVKTRVDSALGGETPKRLSIRINENEVLGLITGDSNYSPEALTTRPYTLGKMLFDRIRRLRQVDVESPRQVASAIQSRGLYEALIAMNAHGDEQAFLDRFQKGAKSMNIYDYIRPLVVIDLVLRHPDMIQDLNTTSLVFPHLHFLKKQTRFTIADIEKLIAEFIPEMIPEELSKILPDVVRYIGIRKDRGKGRYRLGKYVLMDGNTKLGYEFSVDNFPQDSGVTPEEHLDSIFEDGDLRRELVYTVRQISDAIYKSTKRQGFDVTKLKKPKFKFALSPCEYHYMVDVTKRYARNQLLGSFQKNQGKKPNETYLTRRYGLTPFVVDENNLGISDEYTNSTLRIPRDNQFSPTLSGMPFLAFILNRYEQSANVIRASSQ